MSGKNSLRPLRLNKKRDIQLVFNNKQFIINSEAFLLFASKNRCDNIRFCISIKRKHFKKASSRNYMRRLAREWLRQSNYRTLSLDCILIFKQLYKINIDNEILFFKNNMDTLLEKIFSKLKIGYDKSL